MAEIRHNQGEAGGYLVGNRHSEGGIKAVNKSTGQPLEMEGGEVVITRDAVSDPQKRSFNGKMMTNRQILSEINQSGGGVAFADGGEVPEVMHFDGDAEYEYGGKTMCGCDLASKMSARESFDDGGSVKMEAQELPYVGDGYFKWEKREFQLAKKNYKVGRIDWQRGFVSRNPMGTIEDLFSALDMLFKDFEQKTAKSAESINWDPKDRSHYFSAGINVEAVFSQTHSNPQLSHQYNQENIYLLFGPYSADTGEAKIPSGQSPSETAFFGKIIDDWLLLEERPSFFDFYVWLREKLSDPDSWIQINPPNVWVDQARSSEKEFIIDDDLKRKIILEFLAYLDKAIVPYITAIQEFVLFEDNGTLRSPNDFWDADKNGWLIASKDNLYNTLVRQGAYNHDLMEGSPLNQGTAKRFDAALKKMLKERPELDGQKITLFLQGMSSSLLIGVQTWTAVTEFVISKKSSWENLKDIILGDIVWGNYFSAYFTNANFAAGTISFDTLSSRFIECDDSTLWKGGYVFQELNKTTDKTRGIADRLRVYGPPMRSVDIYGDWSKWTSEEVSRDNLEVVNSTAHGLRVEEYNWNYSGPIKKFVAPVNPVAKGFEILFKYNGLYKQGERSNYVITGSGYVEFFSASLFGTKKVENLYNAINGSLNFFFNKNGVFARKSDNFWAAFGKYKDNSWIFGEDLEDIFSLGEGGEARRAEALVKAQERAKEEAEKKRKAEERAQMKAEAEARRKEEIRTRPYQINDQPEDLAKFSLDFTMPEAQPLLKDLEALQKLLTLAQGLRNAPLKRAILLKIRRLTERRNALSIQENSLQQNVDSKKLMTPMGLMVYYYNQARQSPVSKMGEPCGLETPTGVPSKLDIQAYHAVRTPYFKAWFGDWEQAAETGNYVNCSLLVDEDTKEPRIMYHGVRRFDPRVQTGAMGAGVRRPFGEFNPPKFPATYFGDSLDYVEFYAGQAENQPKIDPNYEGFIYSVFINMRNPIRLEGLGLYSSYKDLLAYVAIKYGIIVQPSKDLLQQMQSAQQRLKVWNYVRRDFNFIIALKKAGYDGIIQYGDVPNFNPEGNVSGMKEAKEYLVFSANQVKSALVKKSFYLPQFNDIRFKDGGNVRL